MNIKGVLIGGSIASFAIMLAVVGFTTKAATKEYSFVVRGIVESVDTSRNTINVRGTYGSARARTATVGINMEYRVADADFFKWENGVKVQRNLNFVEVADEVVLSGDKMVGTQYNVTKLTINDRTFTVVGRVKSVDTGEDYIEVLVGRSTYKQAGFNNEKVKFYYNGDTACMRLGSEIGCSEITALNQGIKLKGEVTGADHKWEITNAWNSYPL